MSAIHPLRKIIRILAAPAVAALFAASASPAQAQAKLIALWNFNDASITNKTTASPHGYTGALTAGAAFTADGGGHSGKAGDRAMDFGTNQTGQRVVVNGAGWLNPYTTNDQVTVSLWVRHYFTNLVAGSAFWMVSPSSTGSARGFQAHLPWDNDQVFFDSAGCCTTDETRIQGDISGFSGWTGDDSFWTNWHNFVFVKNAATKQIWIDGTLFLEGGGTTVLPGDFTQIVIGAASDGGGNLIGQIDDFAVFASALDATTIGKLAQGPAPASLDADTDGDGMPDWWEDAHGLNKNSAADASQDADNDGLTNLQEWVKGTDPKNADSDGDGLKDGVETGTGTFVSATNTGTDPNNWDSDGDTLSDGVETGTGKFVSASDTGSNPTKTDTDGDAYSDITEVTLGSNPVDSKITPVTAGKPNLLAFYDFNDASSVETTKDKVHGIVGRLDNGAAYTPDAGGHTGKAGDKAMDFGSDSNG
ncbi:MAG TPA: LamG-like jellyroll fold domain-containing protein, partial [Verrucomicrobiae bacterium]|nr:LamG-like jellyroll fold domain-containing protein [Verrucomicrobiae bacterium]